jgi:hypothetical protein
MIECYYSSCEHHGCHFNEEGPFCNEEECVAPAEKQAELAENLIQERKERKWAGMCSILKQTAS